MTTFPSGVRMSASRDLGRWPVRVARIVCWVEMLVMSGYLPVVGQWCWGGGLRDICTSCSRSGHGGLTGMLVGGCSPVRTGDFE